MATMGTNAVTLLDLARTLDPNGEHARIIEILAKQNEVLTDMKFIEGNLPTGHRSVVQTGLPSVTWRLLNYGVIPSKGTDKQVTDTAGSLEAYAEVDKRLADLNGNSAAFRLGQERKFLEAMNQEMAQTLFYGSTLTDAEEFMGLTPRYNASTAETAANVVKADGTGSDNTSIWLVCWGDDKVCGFYPRGQIAGLRREDLGQVTLDDGSSGKYEGFRTHYVWEMGLCVSNWKYAVRIANIDISNLDADLTNGFDIMDSMVQALEIPPSLDGAAFYMNGTIKSMLRRQTLQANSNLALTYDQLAGKPQMEFGGVPIRRCDQLHNAEGLYA